MLRNATSAFTRVFGALWRCAADPGVHCALRAALGPGSAVHREVRCTASGTRDALLHTLSAVAASQRFVPVVQGRRARSPPGPPRGTPIPLAVALGAAALAPL